MSRKKIQDPNEPENPFEKLGIAREILEYPDNYTVDTEKGAYNYGQALFTLVKRFEGSNMNGDPEKLAQNTVHQLIAFMGQLVPQDFNNQPVSIPELAAIFGAAIGMGAASALDRVEVSMKEVEAQVDCFYVALREGVPRGILAT